MAWIPLESNPDVMNKFLGRLGVPAKWKLLDVVGLDSELLALIPRPTVAFILLFPSSEKYKKLRSEQEADIKEKGQKITENMYYMKQCVSNACGTIAIIHSIANNLDEIHLGDGFLKKFLDDSKKMSPNERGDFFKEAVGIAKIHSELAAEGQTAAPAENEPVIHHFVAFIHKDGALYELDGSKSFPINHGPTTPGTFIEDSAKVLKGIMKKDPSEVHFTVCALTAGDEN